MRDLVVDSFAGGGGASTGIEWALGRSPDIAVNHDPEAVAMHEANHPSTRHLCGDVWDVNPREVCGGREVELAWFSPDCKHFSKAKGGKPVEQGVRGLAWVVVRWAREVRPRVIILENVEEFQTWGPLLESGLPDPSKRGFTFRRWAGSLKAAGYTLEMRQLRACDYGAPTSRKRLFVIARCDGQPIVWPEPTHGPGLLPYRTAGDCMDWSLPCPSIFARKKALAEKTLARIARGIDRYVINTAKPFIVPMHGREASPTLVQTGYGERKGQDARALDLDKPLGTVVAGGVKHALVAAFLARHYGGHGNDGAPLTGPMHTITCQDHHALVTAELGSNRSPEVRAFLTKFRGTDQQLALPLGTVATGGLVRVDGEMYEIADIGMRMLSPRELFRAQGFGDDYVIDPIFEGKPLTKTAQVRMCGNSVSPVVARALVSANVASAQRAVA